MLSLAVQSARSAEGAVAIAIAAIVLIVLVGIATILMLGTAWRRYNRRINKSCIIPDKTANTDLWQAAADRLNDHDPPSDDVDPDSPDSNGSSDSPGPTDEPRH